MPDPDGWKAQDRDRDHGPVAWAAIARGWISGEQLATALGARPSGCPVHEIDDVLVECGLLTREQVEELRRTARGAGDHPGTTANPAHNPAPTLPASTLPETASSHPPPTILTEACAVTARHSTVAPPADFDATLPADPHSPPTPAYRPAAPAADAADPAGRSASRRRFGRYELLAELGRGGMGVVYKAWHPELKAHFALKLLLAGPDASTEEVRRFRQEAQAAARLRHPGVVGVVDIGEVDGKTYFAMEYVDGVGLDRVLADPVAHGLAPAPGARTGARPGLPVAVAVRMARDIADGVHAAHLAGVVHRDLKPQNVLRDRDGRLRVTDFGLARLVDAGGGGATRTGTLMGTPAYMSPEQAEGRAKELDARSDVYQVGAILYELLTGAPPHDGDTPMDVVRKAANEEPVPPRRHNPRIDRDAETICRKAMARDRRCRYASAREVAEDCGRFLSGEAILARPEAWWERPLRWARRRPALAATAAAALVALVASAALGWSAWRAGREGERDRIAREASERERARLAEQVLDALANEVGLYVDATLRLRRKGVPVAEIDEFAPQLRVAMGKAEREAPKRPEPHFFQGRLARALMRFGVAKEEQEKALALDSGFAPSLYERAVLLAAERRERIDRLRRAWLAAEGMRLSGSPPVVDAAGGEGMRPVPGDEVLAQADGEAKRLAAEIVADLDRLQDRVGAEERVPAGGRPLASLTKAQLQWARALRLCLSDPPVDREAARRTLREIQEANPGMEEATEALAGGAATLEEATAIWSRGIEADQGYVPFRLGRAEAFASWGLVKRSRGEDPTRGWDDAIADFGRALELDPKSAAAYAGRGDARVNRGTEKSRHGEDPSELYVAAIADYGRTLELAPGSVRAWMHRGAARVNLCCETSSRGGKPSETWAAALADFDRALEIDSACAEAWRLRGAARESQGRERAARGEDPSELYAAAIADLGRSLELDPAPVEAWTGRGRTHVRWGATIARRGGDATVHYAAAIADFDRALERNPAAAEARRLRADTQASLGTAMANRDGDPSGPYAAAIADYGKLLERSPAAIEARVARGGVRASWASVTMNRGGDPSLLWDAAIADFSGALGLDPRCVEAHWRRGSVYAVLQRPVDATTDFEAALKIDPSSERFFRDLLAEARATLTAYGSADRRSEPPWVDLLRRGRASIRAGDYAGARGPYEEALAAAGSLPDSDRARLLADATIRATLMGAQYNLGCIYSHASAGRAARGGPVRPVPPEEAARLRELAFEHLARAIDLGWPDRSHMANDPDLVPLHADERWQQLLRR